jgi:hypothetical protein
MSKRLHILDRVTIDLDTMTASCLECGQVDVVMKAGSVRCGPARRHQRQRHKEQKRAHGLTLTEAREFRAGKSCAVCGSTEKLVVDHCHKRKKLRDPLCHGCNVGLGMFGEDPARLREAAAYLERWVAYFDSLENTETPTS